MLKILQTGLQQYVNQELLDVKAGFRKDRGIRDQIANIHWIIEKEREFQKNTYSASLTTLKPLTVWITTNWQILTDGYTRSPYLPPEKPVCRLGSNNQNYFYNLYLFEYFHFWLKDNFIL